MTQLRPSAAKPIEKNREKENGCQGTASSLPPRPQVDPGPPDPAQTSAAA